MARVKSKSHVGVYRELLDNGDITYYFTYKDLDGRKCWVKVGRKSDGYSERDAVVQRRKVLAKLSDSDEPLYIKKRRAKRIITIKDLAEKYFSEKKDIKNHRDAYLKYKNKIEPFFGKRNILLLREEEVNRFKNRLIEEGYRPASVNNYLALLKAIINYSIKWGFINIVNPCNRIPLMPLDNARRRVLSESEIEELLANLVHKPKAYLFVLIAIFTGARPKAILNLKRKDIDTNRGTITFIAMKKRPPYTIAIHRALEPTLFDWIKDLAPNEYLFYRENPSLNKKVHISSTSIRDKIQPVMDRLFNKGLETNDRINKVTLYTLRHSFGSLLSKSGANAFVIKELMNHSKIDMTDRYVKVSPEEAKKYIDKIL